MSQDVVKFDSTKGVEIAVDYTDLKTLSASLQSKGYWTIDLMVRSVNMSSPADKVGIKNDDIFTKLEGKMFIALKNCEPSFKPLPRLQLM